MNAPGDPFDRVTRKKPLTPPPCPPDPDGITGCWDRLPGGGWSPTRGFRDCCKFDDETALWTRCVPREEAQ